MIDQYPPANGVLTSLIWRKTAAGGETSLSGYDNATIQLQMEHQLLVWRL